MVNAFLQCLIIDISYSEVKEKPGYIFLKMASILSPKTIPQCTAMATRPGFFFNLEKRASIFSIYN